MEVITFVAVVKGNVEQACARLRERFPDAEIVRTRPTEYDEAILTVYTPTAREDTIRRLQEWFAETNEPPFPPGALLWWNLICVTPA
jgi:hypothetical protein